MPNTENRPGRETGAAEINTKDDGAIEYQGNGNIGVPEARATVHAPAANRRRYLVVVERCPYCTRCHIHFGWRLTSIDAAIRSGCGKPYRLRLVHKGRGGRG